MPNVRPLNRRYGISKHAFLTAYSYCHQYREWHKALTSGAREDDHGSSVAEIEEKIRKIENTVAEAVQDYPALYPLCWSMSQRKERPSSRCNRREYHAAARCSIRCAAASTS